MKRRLTGKEKPHSEKIKVAKVAIGDLASVQQFLESLREISEASARDCRKGLPRLMWPNVEAMRLYWKANVKALNWALHQLSLQQRAAEKGADDATES